ncbi:MAG: carbohydrate binding domain-containing protein, partial [Marmoricola sp.]
MPARSKFVVPALVISVMATGALAATAPVASAAPSRVETMSNGDFDLGRAGWYARTATTKVTIVNRGRGGSKAAQLSNRRSGRVVLDSRRVARSTDAGESYTVSAFVRSTQRGAVGRMVLRESSNGVVVRRTYTGFRTTRAWRQVTMTATTREADTDLSVRFVLNRLRP